MFRRRRHCRFANINVPHRRSRLYHNIIIEIRQFRITIIMSYAEMENRSTPGNL